MKICNRDYAEGSMLATKTHEGIKNCPNCDKPALCHNKSKEYRALFWALSDDTGISSKTILRHMMAYPAQTTGMPPSDQYDRARCIRLLELIPEWIPRLAEMRETTQKTNTGITISSNGIRATRNSWAEQIPLIMKEGRF